MSDRKAVRVQKIIADSGLCSRREAERLIDEGRVRINGTVASPGDKASEADTVTVGRKRLPQAAPRKVVVLMNKPKGFVCSNADPHNPKTVFDLLPPDLQQLRLFSVGRLDKDSEGLLLLTNDGGLSQQITHPASRIEKVYRVTLHRDFNHDDIPKLLQGVEVEGEWLKVERVTPAPAKGPEAGRRLEVALEHGKKREIRRLFEAHRYYVKKLVRVRIGGLVLRNLPKGAVKVLSQKEIKRLLP